MEWVRFGLTAVLMLAGLAFCCIGVYGIFKFEYAANRMHAAAVVDTMGISLCMVGLAISAPDHFSGLKILLVVIFWWLSSPVASHLLCRLEIVTDEQRGEYMTVHDQTIAQERAAMQETCEAENANASVNESVNKEVSEEANEEASEKEEQV